MPTPNKENETLSAKEIYEIGKKTVSVTEIEGVPVVVAPSDMKVHDLENLYERTAHAPRRLEKSIQALSPEGFLEYYNRFANSESTIFANPSTGFFKAILDYHSAAGVPNWCAHSISYACPKTVEWGKWLKFNNEHMSQEEFALFIEDQVNQIREPNGAVMLEIATTLKSKTEANFSSSMRLDNGEVQFNFTEEIKGNAGINGQMSIPETFEISLAPFQNFAAYKLQARFRYRQHSGKLKMWYTIQQPHLVLEDAVSDILKTIQDGMKAGQLIAGTTD